MVTWCVGGPWLLLLEASWRVLNEKCYYKGGDQILSAADYPLSRCNMQLGIKLSQDLVAGATYTGVGPLSVNRRAELSSEIRDGLKKINM